MACPEDPERANKLRRWFELLIENQDDLGRLMTLESFMPARCWIAPEMPTAIYSWVATIFSGPGRRVLWLVRALHNWAHQGLPSAPKPCYTLLLPQI